MNYISRRPSYHAHSFLYIYFVSFCWFDILAIASVWNIKITEVPYILKIEVSFPFVDSHRARYLAKPSSYQRVGRNYRYDLGIRTGWDLPIRRPSETKQANAL